MCNSCESLSRIFRLPAADPFLIRFRIFHPIERIVDPYITCVCVPMDHIHRRMAGETLDGSGVGTSLGKIRNGGVSHRVRRHLGQVETCPDDAAPEGLLHAVVMAGYGLRVGENPTFGVRRHLPFAGQDLGHFPS